VLVEQQRAPGAVSTPPLSACLPAAFYDPVWTQGVRAPMDFAIAVVGFLLLAAARLSALWIVGRCVVAAIASSLMA